MKKVFIALFVSLALISCKKEAPEPQKEQHKAPAKDEFVKLSLTGELDQGARAITFVPRTNDQGKRILSPFFEGSPTIKAHYFVYDNDGNYKSGVIDLNVYNGKDFVYDGSINIGGVGSPRFLSVYLGFDEHGNFTNSTHAQRYSATQKMTLNVAFKSEHNELTTSLEGNVYKRNLKFHLIGAIMRCKIENKATTSFRVSQIIASGFGNNGLSVRPPQPSATPPTNYMKPWLAASTSRNAYAFQLPQEIVVRAGKTHPDEYLVYCPNVNAEDPRETEASGSLSLNASPDELSYYDTAEVMYLSDSESKAIGATKHFLSTTLKIEEGMYNPLRYLAPLWLYGMELRPTPESLWSTFYDLEHTAWDASYRNNSKPQEKRKELVLAPTSDPRFRGLRGGWPSGFFIEDDRISQWASNLSRPDFGRHTFQTITKLRYKALFPLFSPEEVYTRDLNTELVLSSYYLARMPKIAYGTVSGTDFKQMFYMKDDYYREPVLDYAPSEQVAKNLLYGGDFQSKPLYALRYQPVGSAPIDSETRRIMKNNRGRILQSKGLRVAYRYTYKKSHLLIESCIVGENPQINSAKDIVTNNVFGTAQRIVKRIIPFIGQVEQQAYQNNMGYGSVSQYYFSNGQSVLTDASVPSSHADHLRIRDYYPQTYIFILDDTDGSEGPARIYSLWNSTDRTTGMGQYRWYRQSQFVGAGPATYIRRGLPWVVIDFTMGPNKYSWDY